MLPAGPSPGPPTRTIDRQALLSPGSRDAGDAEAVAQRDAAELLTHTHSHTHMHTHAHAQRDTGQYPAGITHPRSLSGSQARMYTSGGPPAERQVETHTYTPHPPVGPHSGVHTETGETVGAAPQEAAFPSSLGLGRPPSRSASLQAVEETGWATALPAAGEQTGLQSGVLRPAGAALPVASQQYPQAMYPNNGAFPRPQRGRGTHAHAHSSSAESEENGHEYGGLPGYPNARTRAAAIRVCCCGRHVGNTIVCYECPGSSPRAHTHSRGRAHLRFPFTCTFGPDWPCTAITYALIIGPSCAFLAFVAPSLHVVVFAVGIVLAIAALYLLTLTACSDPGIVPKQSREQLDAQKREIAERGQVDEYTLCQYCNIMRLADVTHCYDCNTCIIELDHHCPWMGKCIGKNNLYAFYGFLWSVLALILYTGGGLFAWIIVRAAKNDI